MSPRRTFGPTVLVGLGSAALAAVAASKPWALPGQPGEQATTLVVPGRGLEQESPLAVALALLLLATWGVLLVTRGRVRRVLACFGVLVAVGLLVTTVEAWWSLQDAVRADLAELGLRGEELDAADAETTMSGWYATTLVVTPLALLALVGAVLWCPRWPEMGSRYDAPGAHGADSATATPPGERSNLDLWKQLDEGHDPTR